jgi:hypothetical protein
MTQYVPFTRLYIKDRIHIINRRFHNSYTSDDERLLVKYIAKYNPHGVGRKGNVLYKALVDNVRHSTHLYSILNAYLSSQEQKKWSWAKRHPWQSWRDRYCKNRDWYEKQIRIYQKKHGIDATQPPKASPATQRKRARDDSGDSESGEDVKEEKDARRRKRHKGREVRGRAEMKQRRDRLKEEEEEEEEEKEKEEEENDMGEGTSKGSRGRRIMRVSTVKKAKVESQIADDVTYAKPKEDGNPAVEEQDADNEGSGEDGEQENQGPVGSDDYQGGIFGSSEDEIGEAKVNQLMDANVESETEEEMDAQEVDQQLIAPSRSESTQSSSRNK